MKLYPFRLMPLTFIKLTLLTLLLIVANTPSLLAQSSTDYQDCVPGEYIAVETNTTDPQPRPFLVTPFGTPHVIREFRGLALGQKRIYHVTLSQSIGHVALLQTQNSSLQLFPNCIKRISDSSPMASPPTDPIFTEQWGLNNSGQEGGIPGIDIRLLGGWDYSKGDNALVVAVLDNGIDYSHPDLASNMWSNPNEIPNNFLDDDANGFVDDRYGADTVHDDGDPLNDYISEPPSQLDIGRGHGTHVAGIIAASENGAGVVGVAPRVKIMAVRVLGETGGTDATILEGLSYVLSMRRRGVNIRVVNMSLGGQNPCPLPYLEVFSALAEEGVVVVAAAGNGGGDSVGDNIDFSPVTPASCQSPNLISVADVTRTGELSVASNYGRQSVDLAAPGTEIWSTFPNRLLARLSGTSMAAPHVSGALALLFSLDPFVDPSEARLRVMETVTLLPALSGYTNAPGILNVSQLLANVRSINLSVQFISRRVRVTKKNGSLIINAQARLSDPIARVRQAYVLVKYQGQSYRVSLRARTLPSGEITLRGSARILERRHKKVLYQFVLDLVDGTKLIERRAAVRVTASRK